MKKILLLLLVSTLVFMTSCTTTKRKNFVVLIDNSISIPQAVMLNYIKTIQETILPNMAAEDKLVIEFIDACSERKAERIFACDLAEMDFSNKQDGINNADDSTNERLKRYLDETKNEMADTILAKRKERKSCGNYTDIINALNEAAMLVKNEKNYTNKTDETLNNAKGDENYEYETCIVIFSDMINENETKTFDFTSYGKLKKADVNKKIEELKQLNKIPDLKGAKILVYGATSSKEAGLFAEQQIENVKLFWKLFFDSAHADLKGYGYDTQIELKNYLVAR